VSLIGQASAGVVPRLVASGSVDVIRNKHMWTGGGDASIVLQGFEVDGDRADNAGLGGENYGINLYAVDSATLDHLYVHGCTGSGVIAKYLTGSTIKDSTASANAYTSSWDASGINFNQYCTGNTVTRCACNDNNSHRDSGTGVTYDGNGIRIGDWCTGNTVSNNTCDANGRRGIKVQAGSNTVTGNTLAGNLAVSLFVGGVNGTDGNIIRDNIITGAPYDAGIQVGDGDWAATTSATVLDRNSITGSLYGIDLEAGVDQATISASTVSASVGHGVLVKGDSNILITGCAITDSGSASVYNGVELVPASGVNPLFDTVTACTITDDRATKEQAYGVKSETGADYTTVTSNALGGNLWGEYQLAGTHNTVSGNTP
jgi:parallel beta-helix repeat protein